MAQRDQKRLVLLGSTGSIGTQALDVLRQHPGVVKLTAISAKSSAKELASQAREFDVEAIGIFENSDVNEEVKHLIESQKVYFGENANLDLIDYGDVVLNALVGFAGLKSSLETLSKGKTLLLANKESLVAGGDLLKFQERKNSSQVIPIDSEHSAIFQGLKCGNHDEVSRLIITSSGGPFRNLNQEELKTVGIKDALKHPTWSMGEKITIDSSTLMNKGLEIIEAHYLFDIPYENIEVVIHPQSIVHSLVEFVDGSQIAQLALPDMKIPISYALGFPKRLSLQESKLDLVQISKLEFYKPDERKFPCLRLAREAALAGGSCLVALNASNEVAVEAFLQEKIKWIEIAQVIEHVLNEHEQTVISCYEDVLQCDTDSRQYSWEFVTKILSRK